MARYRLKERVEAVQWTGLNHTEIHIFLRVPMMPPLPYFAWINDVLKIRTTDGRDIQAIPGDYIVRNSQGNVFTMQQYKFYEHYERID